MGNIEKLMDRFLFYVNNADSEEDVRNFTYEYLQKQFNYNGDKESAFLEINKCISDYKTNPAEINNIVNRLYGNLIGISEQVNTRFIPTNINKSGGSSVIDIDEDTLDSTMENYQFIEEEKKDNKIDTEGYVQQVFSEYQQAITEKEVEIDELYQQNGQEIVTALEEMSVIDMTSANTLKEDDINFSELIQIYSMHKNTGSKIVEASSDTFVKAGYTVENNIVTIKDTKGVEYKYNIASNLLTDSSGHSLTVKYYLPSDNVDLSSLNTVTCLGGHGEASIYETTGKNSFHLDDIKADSILVMPRKNNYNNMDMTNKNISYAYMSQDVIAGTTFATLFSKQSNDCENYIIGCSSGGGSAVKIASQAEGLYDTAVSVNYAPIFDGGGKGVNREYPLDDNRLKDNEIANLNNNGTKLVYISSSSDPNLDGGRNSYVYQGLNRIVSSCPDLDITFMTNNTSNIYKNIPGNNYHYFGKDSDFWQNFLGDYGGHTYYHNAFKDMINSGIFS